MADAAAIRRVEEEIARDPAGAKLKRAILKEADGLVNQAPVAWDPDDGLGVARTALRRLQALGMAWLLEHKAKYADQAKLELLAICGFSHWHPSHFLTTAEMTHAAAIGYDWFHDRLSGDEKKICVDAILQKGLCPGLRDLKGETDARWPGRVNNWNIVCNAGLMIGALAVGEESGLPQEVFARCLKSVQNGFRGYAPDGSWDEGPGYWSYATTYVAYLLSALDTAVDQDFGLGDLPGMRDTGFFRMHSQGAAGVRGMDAPLFNFSDCKETHRGSWCMAWLWWRYKKREYNWVARADAQGSPMDLLWFSAEAPPPGGSFIPRHALFRGGASVAMFRGKTTRGFQPWDLQLLNTDTLFLGIRAGANGVDNHHGHLDLGGFVLDAEQQRWAIDLPYVDKPPQGYVADYKLEDFFVVELDKRFRYYRTGTIGHNTLLIDGEKQALGIDTEIVAFAATPGLNVAVIDLSAAYPTCVRARRGFALICERHVLIVDELTPRKKVSVTWQMHTRATARRGATARLEQGGKTFFVRMREPPDVAFDIQLATAVGPEAPNEEDVKKLVAILPAVDGPTRIAVLLSATIDSVGELPEPLPGPLSSWIEWARGKKQHDAHLFGNARAELRPKTRPRRHRSQS
jgi:hypothetical protein